MGSPDCNTEGLPVQQTQGLCCAGKPGSCVDSCHHDTEEALLPRAAVLQRGEHCVPAEAAGHLSGVADTSCFPEGLMDGLRHGKKPDLEAAKAESELVLYTVVEDLLRKTGIAPSEVSPSTALGQHATH